MTVRCLSIMEFHTHSSRRYRTAIHLRMAVQEATFSRISIDLLSTDPCSSGGD